MPRLDLVVKNGNVVVPGQGIIRVDLGIKGEKIVCISENLDMEASFTIDAKGMHVFPGLIDPHVHIGLWIPFYEDLLTESKGAAAGGVTTMLVTMGALDKLKDLDTEGLSSHSSPEELIRYSGIFPQVERGARGCSIVDYALRFMIGGKVHIDELEFCYKQFGIGSFKFFTAFKNRPATRGIDDGLIYHALKTVSKMEPPPILQAHCENDELVEWTTQETKKSGLEGLRAWNAARSNLAEEEAIARVCLLARRTGSSIYIVHVSTAEGVEVVAEEQRKGTRVTAETSVHYLGLTEEMEGVVGKASPPLRKQSDVDKLWEGIESGVITCVGTDHVSRKLEKKEGDIWAAVAAWPAMEILLPVMITQAIKRNVSVTTVAEVCALNCAKVFRLFPKKGTIAVGSDADLVLVDLKEERTVDASRFHSVSKFCPYDGMKLVGWPKLTILRGKVIYSEKGFSEPIGKMIRVTPEGVSQS
jgi:dihydropyrimidinase